MYERCGEGRRGACERCSAYFAGGEEVPRAPRGERERGFSSRVIYMVDTLPGSLARSLTLNAPRRAAPGGARFRGTT